MSPSQRNTPCFPWGVSHKLPCRHLLPQELPAHLCKTSTAAVSPALLWATDWGPVLAPCSSSQYVSPHNWSPAGPMCSLSPFTSILKPCQWVLQAPEQRPPFSFEKGESCLMPASLVPCRPSRCQKSPRSHVLIDWVCLFLAASPPATERREEKVSCAPDSLTSHPKALLWSP